MSKLTPLSCRKRRYCAVCVFRPTQASVVVQPPVDLLAADGGPRVATSRQRSGCQAAASFANAYFISGCEMSGQRVDAQACHSAVCFAFHNSAAEGDADRSVLSLNPVGIVYLGYSCPETMSDNNFFPFIQNTDAFSVLSNGRET